VRGVLRAVELEGVPMRSRILRVVRLPVERGLRVSDWPAMAR
jgi:hypothetical protein